MKDEGVFGRGGKKGGGMKDEGVFGRGGKRGGWRGGVEKGGGWLL